MKIGMEGARNLYKALKHHDLLEMLKRESVEDTYRALAEKVGVEFRLSEFNGSPRWNADEVLAKFYSAST